MEKETKENDVLGYPHCVFCGNKIWLSPGELVSEVAYGGLCGVCNACNDTDKTECQT